MGVKNYICENCDKSGVCKWADIIDKFSEEKKNPVGVTISIVECDEEKHIE